MNRKTTTIALTAALLALAGTGVSAQSRGASSHVAVQSAARFTAKEASAKKPTNAYIRTSENFTLNSWNSNSFKWEPRENAPQELLAENANTPIVATKGLVRIKEAGAHTFTFEYQKGNNKLVILGVDLCDLEGNVVAKDYHKGETGNSSTNNAYTLTVPQEGVYEVRYFVAKTTADPITSSGVIKTNPEVFNAVVVNDLENNESPRWEVPTETTNIPEGVTKIGNEGGSFPWKPEEWLAVTEIPAEIANMEASPKEGGKPKLTAANVRAKEVQVYISGVGTIKVEYLFRKGNMALFSVGAELVDAEGNVVSTDYHQGESGNNQKNNIYTLSVPQAGRYTLRFLAENKTRYLDSSGDAKVHSTLKTWDVYHMPKGSFYALNFDKEAHTSNTHGEWRRLYSLSFAPQYGAETKFVVYKPEEGRAFEDFTSKQHHVKVMPGAEVSMKLDYRNNWMHTYLYIDANGNKKFDVENLNDEELLLCTYLKKQKKTREGVTASNNPSPVMKDPLLFNAPEKPGTYRMRCKIEWDNLDPGAKGAGTNTIFGNDGKVVDFILEVQDPAKVDNSALASATYDVTVREGKNGNFATMQVPFAVTLPEHMRAYRLTNPREGEELHFEALPGDVVPANTPVFLVSTKAGTFTCNAAPYQAPVETNLYGSLIPVTQAMRDQDSEFKYYALILDHKTKLWEFRAIRQGVTIPANRCFLKLHKNTPASTTKFKIPELKPTGISSLITTNSAEDAATYNLAGQRIDAATTKGVVIRNGKKVVLP